MPSRNKVSFAVVMAAAAIAAFSANASPQQQASVEDIAGYDTLQTGLPLVPYSQEYFLFCQSPFSLTAKQAEKGHTLTVNVFDENKDRRSVEFTYLGGDIFRYNDPVKKFEVDIILRQGSTVGLPLCEAEKFGAPAISVTRLDSHQEASATYQLNVTAHTASDPFRP